MSTTTLTVQRRATWTRVGEYAELTKPRILVMVLITVGVSGYAAQWGNPDVWLLLHAMIGTGLVAASASALNQWLERDRDARMPRTARRPLPSGRISDRQAATFGAVTVLVGLAYTVTFVNAAAASWSLLTWALYVWVYTPLKSQTWLNTVVGAVPGALPTLIGWTAAGGQLDVRAAALFLIVFLWQFPHFMAIAWLYRRQYGSAGLQMLTVVDPTGRRAGIQAVTAALTLLPVSLLPGLLVPTSGGTAYVACAFLLGLAQLTCAALFFVRTDEHSARRLLRASLLYLPALLALLMLQPLF